MKRNPRTLPSAHRLARSALNRILKPAVLAGDRCVRGNRRRRASLDSVLATMRQTCADMQDRTGRWVARGALKGLISPITMAESGSKYGISPAPRPHILFGNRIVWGLWRLAHVSTGIFEELARTTALLRVAQAQEAAPPHAAPHWVSYSGGAAIILTIVLLAVACGFAYAGRWLRVPIAVARPGAVAAGFMIAIWLMAIYTVIIATYIYGLQVNRPIPASSHPACASARSSMRWRPSS